MRLRLLFGASGLRRTGNEIYLTSGGPMGIRTPHLFYAIEALYQMSYRPLFRNGVYVSFPTFLTIKALRTILDQPPFVTNFMLPICYHWYPGEKPKNTVNRNIFYLSSGSLPMCGPDRSPGTIRCRAAMYRMVRGRTNH